jgi:hypothetical protein
MVTKLIALRRVVLVEEENRKRNMKNKIKRLVLLLFLFEKEVGELILPAIYRSPEANLDSLAIKLMITLITLSCVRD